MTGPLYSLSRKEGWRRYVEAPARERPGQLPPGQLKRLDGAAREQYDEARHDWHANFGILRTPQLAAVHDELEVIVTAGQCDPDRVRGAAVIDALPGLGKTTAVNSFARSFDRDQIRRHGPLTGQGHERIPVFRVGLTSNTTLRTLNRMICEFYGHPGAGRASAPRPLENVLAGITATTAVLVISDAGAARRQLDIVRLADTIGLVKALRTGSAGVAWLNPVPREQWARTTAGQVARHVPMFPFTRQGLYQAVDALRGRPFLVERPV